MWMPSGPEATAASLESVSRPWKASPAALRIFRATVEVLSPETVARILHRSFAASGARECARPPSGGGNAPP